MTLGNDEDMRVAYINKEISKEQLATSIYRNDNRRKKYLEYLHVYELLSVVGIDIFRYLVNTLSYGVKFKEEFNQKKLEYNKLRIHCNDLFANISRTYSQSAPQIDDEWNLKSKKFSGKPVDRIIEEEEEEKVEEVQEVVVAEVPAVAQTAVAEVPAVAKKKLIIKKKKNIIVV